MLVKPVQKRDGEIVRLRREMERTEHQTDGETSETLTEPDTDTEEQLQELYKVWVGSYLLNIQSRPAHTEKGWVAGKGPLATMPFDLLLCTSYFAKTHDINVRNPHVRFNFSPESRGLFIVGCSTSSSAQLTVNGDPVELRPYYLNQNNMKIQIAGKLKYCFLWTNFAANDDFLVSCRDYVARTFDRPLAANMDSEMPTPFFSNSVTGKWTLGDALGKGGVGRVFFASDSSGNLAAIKVLERNARNSYSVDKEIQILKEVNSFAEKADKDEQILRVAEVIYTKDEKFSFKTTFDNVAIVLKPITRQTFGNLMGSRSSGQLTYEFDMGSKGMTIEAATAFRSALLGVKVMHDGCWLHQDLKPSNIGLTGTPRRSVLLDVGTSKRIQAGGSLRPNPGGAGTIGYLAPERELEDYDQSIDIWAMGIILFELTYNPTRGSSPSTHGVMARTTRRSGLPLK
ncbi:hypothetical protein MMC25_003220 [Agyrium rufum]|nr:hypothetical protein [Agyrium rufum]